VTAHRFYARTADGRFVSEWAIEQRLCAVLEAEGDLVARQLGTGATAPANRIADVVQVDPGSTFEARTRLTDAAIPDLVIAADVGVGRAKYWKNAVRGLDVHPDRAQEAIDRAIELGFLEAERRNGRTYVRQVARYPTDWFSELTAIELKPDLDRPGDLTTQLRTDVALGLVDRVVLVTTSHVTPAHRHRFPAPVGIWRLAPDDPSLDVLRPADRLSIDEPGIELLERHPGRDEIAVVEPTIKAQARRRLAERAYAKGWRPEAPVSCEHAALRSVAGVGGLSACTHFEQLVVPSRDCGTDCSAFEPADPPTGDPRAARDRHSPWVADPPGQARTQGRLDRYGAAGDGPQSS